MKLIFAHITIFLFVLGCTKDKGILPMPIAPSPPSDFIQMKFVFVNEGDTAMNTINLESSFYRIQTNDSWISYKNYPTILPNDSIVHYSDSGKIGSQKKFDVELGWIQNGLLVKRVRYLSTLSADTLKTQSDGLEIFRWPQDTNRYIKVSQWP